MSNKVNTDDCWHWAGVKNSAGYGLVLIDRKYYRAHTIIYEALKGPIPKGLVPDHLCEVKCCINPKHIEPVTNRENIKRYYKNHGAPPGFHQYGENNPFSRYKREDILKIRDEYKPGMTKAEVARKLGMNYNTVKCILNGRSWTWLRSPEANHD